MNHPDNPQPESVAFTLAEWEAEVAAAEERGYRRGRNESIQALMAQPGYFETIAATKN